MFKKIAMVLPLAFSLTALAAAAQYPLPGPPDGGGNIAQYPLPGPPDGGGNIVLN